MNAIDFPNPVRVHIPSKFQNVKQPSNIPTMIVDTIAQEAGDTGTIGNASKIARAIMKLLLATGQMSKEAGTAVVSHLTSVIDTFKVLSIPKSIKTIIDNSKAKEGETKSEKAQRVLKIAAATTGIGVASMTAVRIGDGFVKCIGKISEKMGIASIASAPLRAALSFPVVYSAVELLENAFSIAGSSLKMHDINKKMKHAKEKIQGWQKEPINFDAAGKLFSITEKRTALKLNAETILAPNVIKTGEKWTEAKADYDKIKKKASKTKFAKLGIRCSLKRAEAKLKRAATHYTQACKKLDGTKTSFDKMGTKLERWQVIADKIRLNQLTPKDIDALNAFKADKEQKWKTKVKNITWDKAKEGLSIGMSVFLTLFLITGVALAIIFPLALPVGAIIGLSVGGLLMSLGFTAKHLLPKFMESEKFGKKSYKPVEVPELEKPGPIQPVEVQQLQPEQIGEILQTPLTTPLKDFVNPLIGLERPERT
jgi:hypothetical protein